MTHNQTIAQLQELRLQGMAQALQRQLEQPASTELGFEQRLALLVQHEIDSRHDRRSACLLKRASLKYAQAHIEDFDARASRGLERARWMALALSDWATSGATIILSGATGCGKTWLACALGQYACRQGHSTRYLRLPRLGEELGLVRATGTYTRWLGKLAKTQVLILDDWGLVALDAPCREALMEIIDDRAGNRATLITSQLPVDHWHAWIDEPAVADAMLDRLLPQAQRIVLKGESLRAARTKKTPSSANQS